MSTEASSIAAAIYEAMSPAWFMFSVSNVVGVLATLAVFVAGLAFMWWGLRKAIRALMSAFRKGKVSL